MSASPGRRRRILAGLIEAGLTISGLVVVAVPLALWVSQSVTVYYSILAVGAGGFISFCLLAQAQQRFTGAGASRVEGADGSVPQVKRWIVDLRTAPGQGDIVPPPAGDQEWHRKDMHDPAAYKLRRQGVSEGLRVLGWTFGTAGTLMVSGAILLFLVYLLLS